MEIRVETSNTWRQLNAKFLKAANGKVVRRALTKSLREAAKPAVRDVKAAVLKVESRGVGGGGSKRREASYRVRRPKGRVRGFGLRQTVARLITSRMKYSGIKVGLQIRVNASEMPNRQRRLPWYLDGHGRWRHPVFGNRNRWAGQTGQPYFENTLHQHTPRVRQAAIDGVTKALKELQE